MEYFDSAMTYHESAMQYLRMMTPHNKMAGLCMFIWLGTWLAMEPTNPIARRALGIMWAVMGTVGLLSWAVH